MNREATAVSFELCMDATAKSGRVLYAFTEFYLYFYELDPVFLFKHFSTFGCISVAVYCVDESVERELSAKRAAGIPDLERLLAKRVEPNAYISKLLCDAREYYAFEQSARAGQEAYDLPEVLRISEIRSFDFRLMHHALLQIAGIPYDKEVFDWFKAFETLMEIEDDLPTIKEDEQKGSYNYYCFAKKVVGANVGNIVEAVRVELEQRLTNIGASLHRRGFMRCEHVIERYRRIVPRHPVPTEA